MRLGREGQGGALPSSRTTMLWVSSGPTGTLSSGMLGTSRAASSRSCTGVRASSRALMLSPTPRISAMRPCLASLSFIRGISLDTALRRARSVSTSASSARRRSSRAMISSMGAWAFRATSAALISSACSRMYARSIILRTPSFARRALRPGDNTRRSSSRRTRAPDLVVPPRFAMRLAEARPRCPPTGAGSLTGASRTRLVARLTAALSRTAREWISQPLPAAFPPSAALWMARRLLLVSVVAIELCKGIIVRLGRRVNCRRRLKPRATLGGEEKKDSQD